MTYTEMYKHALNTIIRSVSHNYTLVHFTTNVLYLLLPTARLPKLCHCTCWICWVFFDL